METERMLFSEFEDRIAQIASQWDKTQFQLVRKEFDTREPIYVNEASGPVSYSGNTGYAYYKQKPNGEMSMVGEWIAKTSEAKFLQ